MSESRNWKSEATSEANVRFGIPILAGRRCADMQMCTGALVHWCIGAVHLLVEGGSGGEGGVNTTRTLGNTR